MKILVVNAGSSSLKYQLFDMDSGEVLAKGLCERIGIDGAITHKRPGKEDYAQTADLKDHKAAIELVLSLLTDAELGVIASADEIGAVGHRFAHGGKMKKSAILGEDEIAYLESIIEINPLHGPPAISGFKGCKAVMPNIPHDLRKSAVGDGRFGGLRILSCKLGAKRRRQVVFNKSVPLEKIVIKLR